MVVGWLAGTAFGFRALIRRENQPGESGIPTAAWPQATKIHRDTSKPTLVIVLHPQCACSHATLGELAIIVAHAQVDAHALFYKPTGFTKDWAQSDLWREASAIPGVSAELDDDAREAKLFGASTSGHVLLFNRAGKMIFQGGITPSRAHAGDNVGRTAILALLNGGQPERQKSFVFGCPLRDSQ